MAWKSSKRPIGPIFETLFSVLTLCFSFFLFTSNKRTWKGRSTRESKTAAKNTHTLYVYTGSSRANVFLSLLQREKFHFKDDRCPFPLHLYVFRCLYILSAFVYSTCMLNSEGLEAAAKAQRHRLQKFAEFLVQLPLLYFEVEGACRDTRDFFFLLRSFCFRAACAHASGLFGEKNNDCIARCCCPCCFFLFFLQSKRRWCTYRLREKLKSRLKNRFWFIKRVF